MVKRRDDQQEHVEHRLSAKQFPPNTLSEIDIHIRAEIMAMAEQHPAAMKWIVNELCETYGTCYFPNSSRDTDFALGKRWVGLMIVGAQAFIPVEQKEPGA